MHLIIKVTSSLSVYNRGLSRELWGFNPTDPHGNSNPEHNAVTSVAVLPF